MLESVSRGKCAVGTNISRLQHALDAEAKQACLAPPDDPVAVPLKYADTVGTNYLEDAMLRKGSRMGYNNETREQEQLHANTLRFLKIGSRDLDSFRSFTLDSYRWLKLRYMITRRHFFSRAVNLIVWLSDKNRSIYLHAYPLVITFEANASCNLRCPYCVTGSRFAAAAGEGKASLLTMKAIIDKTYKRSFQIAFHNNGEPFLNDDVYEAIRYARQKGLWTTAHSNLNHTDPCFADKLIESGLNNLVVSCDGATQETYEVYRRGGNIDLVFRNVARVASLKKRDKLKYPWLSAKFHVFDHNWHEVMAYNNKMLSLGVNDVLFLKAFSSGIYATGRAATEKVFNLTRLQWEDTQKGHICPHMWSEEVHVDYDGGVMPCGSGCRPEHLFVPARDAMAWSLTDQLNSGDFITVRRYFLGKADVKREALPFLCRDCEYTLMYRGRGPMVIVRS